MLITGPSRGGIGFETALALARQGATLLLAARNVEKATADAEAIASQILGGPVVPFALSSGYGFPHKVTIPKKGALVIIWVLGYQG